MSLSHDWNMSHLSTADEWKERLKEINWRYTNIKVDTSLIKRKPLTMANDPFLNWDKPIIKALLDKFWKKAQTVKR